MSPFNKQCNVVESFISGMDVGPQNRTFDSCSRAERGNILQIISGMDGFLIRRYSYSTAASGVTNLDVKDIGNALTPL